MDYEFDFIPEEWDEEDGYEVEDDYDYEEDDWDLECGFDPYMGEYSYDC